MASWQRTKPPAVASALPRAGRRDGICLHQRLLMLPQPGVQPKERAVNTSARRCMWREVNELEVRVRGRAAGTGAQLP